MPRTQLERLWIGGGAVLALVVVVIGYFFLIGPQRSKTGEVRTQVADAQLQAGTLQARIASLTSKQKKLGTYRAALAAARAALPTAGDTSASPAFLRSVQAIAHRTSTAVSSLTVADPVPVADAVPVAATGGTTSTAAPATPAATGTVDTTAASASSLYSVVITASVAGTAQHLIAFMTALQHHQPRAVLVSAMTLDSSQTNAFTLSLTMTAFVRPSITDATPTARARRDGSATPRTRTLGCVSRRRTDTTAGGPGSIGFGSMSAGAEGRTAEVFRRGRSHALDRGRSVRGGGPVPGLGRCRRST